MGLHANRVQEQFSQENLLSEFSNVALRCGSTAAGQNLIQFLTRMLQSSVGALEKPGKMNAEQAFEQLAKTGETHRDAPPEQLEAADSKKKSYDQVCPGRKSARYSPEQRKAAIMRWLVKRQHRHLIPKTRYVKMKAVALSKPRCSTGKFSKKVHPAPVQVTPADSMPCTVVQIGNAVSSLECLKHDLVSNSYLSNQGFVASCGIDGAENNTRTQCHQSSWFDLMLMPEE